MNYQNENFGYLWLIIGLICLIVLALAGRSPAAVERSMDNEYKATLIRNGDRGVMRSTGPVEKVKIGERNTTTGLKVLQSAPSTEWFVDQSGVFRPSETTQIIVLPAPVVQAAPDPQQSGISTTMNGIDEIETTAILPEALAVDQLDAVKKIADNGALIAQQRFATEQYKINSAAGLEYLRIIKSFTLWGFVLSIPFLGTVYWIFKQAALGWHTVKKEHLDYKLKELESSERIVQGADHHNLYHHP